MATVFFNNKNQIEVPTIIIQNRNFDNLGKLVGFSDYVEKTIFNNPNEISFSLHKIIKDPERGDVINPLWDAIKDFRIAYIPEREMKYRLTVSETETDDVVKAVTGTELAQCELNDSKLYDIEINTETDIENPLYHEDFPTLFYRKADMDAISDYNDIWTKPEFYGYTDEQKLDVIRHSSLLHRLLEKTTYTIDDKRIDESLKALKWIRAFSISEASVYDELSGEVSEEYGVLFEYDSVNRTIGARDLYNTCEDCGYRGDFDLECPNILHEADPARNKVVGDVCQSTKIKYGYGEDTTVFVSSENLATSITREGDTNSVVNCFKVEGGDDYITAAVAAINPSGTNYIYNFSENDYEEMPQSLKDKLDSYNEKCDYYYHEKVYPISAKNVKAYNDAVNYLNSLGDRTDFYDLYKPITKPLNFTEFMNVYYNTIDVQSIIKTTLAPTIRTDYTETMADAWSLINAMPQVAVKDIKDTTVTVVNNAVLGMIKAVINTALFKPEIVNATWDKSTFKWRGSVKLTEIAVGTDKEPLSETRTIEQTIGSDVEQYLKNQVQKNMAKVEINEALIMTSMDSTGEFQMSDSAFQNALKYYSADNLERIVKMFDACISCLLSLKDKKGFNNTLSGDYFDKFYSKYENRLNMASSAYTQRCAQYDALLELYSFSDATLLYSGELVDIRNSVIRDLNFQTHMGDDWNTFRAYVREDKYSNSNYISDGCSNAEVLQLGEELLTRAKVELKKASRINYTVSTSMNNLLAIPEFQPIVDHFEVGNWIRVRFDEDVYKLRLLSYEINYDQIQDINVEFSTAKEEFSEISYIQEAIESASSMAGTYDAVMKQVDKNANSSAYVRSWVQDGLDATKTKFVNDSLTQDIVIDQNGILCRAYDDIIDEYDNHQIKINRNGLYTTSDNWEHIDVGVGSFIRYEKQGSNLVPVEDYGVLAKTIVAQLVLSEKVNIVNENGSIYLGKGGLTIYNEDKTMMVNMNANSTGNILQAAKEGTGTVFYIDNDGNAYFKGNIDALDGTFKGDLIIGNNYIKKDGTAKIGGLTLSNGTSTFNGTIVTKNLTASDAVNIVSGGITINGNGISSQYFSASANGASFNGSVTATSLIAKDAIFLYNSLYSVEGKVMYYGDYEGKSEGDDTVYLHINGHGGTNNEIVIDGKMRVKNNIIMDSHLHMRKGKDIRFEVADVSGNSVYRQVMSIDSDNNIFRVGMSKEDSDVTGTTTVLRGQSVRIYAHNGNSISLESNVNMTGYMNCESIYNDLSDGGVNVHISNTGRLHRTASSSKRYKNSIVYIDEDSKKKNQIIESVKKLKPCYFKYNNGYFSNQNYDYNKDFFGLIAEDVNEVFEGGVYQENGQVENWNDRPILVGTLALAQENANTIEVLKEQINELKLQIMELKGETKE